MRYKIKIGLFVFFILLFLPDYEGRLSALDYVEEHNHELCTGIFPENDLNIPVKSEIFSITQSMFDTVIDRGIEIYGPIVASKGARLSVRRLWDDGTVNARASQSGGNYFVSMYGGLARHPLITEGAFALVLCHEIGHHLGGTPKRRSFWGDFGSWASNEGQADYFAGLKCFRKLYTSRENEIWYEKNKEYIFKVVQDECQKIYSDIDEQNVCFRFSMAGHSVANMFASIKKLSEAKFETPDMSKVKETDDDHPLPQCRLDTYFAAALCPVDHNIDLSDDNETTGACSGVDKGSRPFCWYKPKGRSEDDNFPIPFPFITEE